MRRLTIIDDAWSGYALREPDVDGGRTIATHISSYHDATLLASSAYMLAALEGIVRALDPDGVAAPDSARCKVCGVHPSTHTMTCAVKGAKDAYNAARGRM
jgi:hypothetical protein